MKPLARAFLPLVFVTLYAFPWFPELRSANEMPRLFLTQEIVDRQTFALDARWAELQRGSTFDVSTTPDGHRYSNKAPGASLLAVPGYVALRAWQRMHDGDEPTLGELTWVSRVTAVTIPSLLFLLFFVAGARRLAPEGAAPALGAVALGSMALPYAILFFSHQLAAAFVGAAFVLAMRRDGFFDAVGIGLLSGMAILCDYQAGLAVLVVGGYLLGQSRARLRDLAGGVLGGVPPMAVLAFYHWVCFGAPWRTGYSFAPDPAHKQGVLGLIGPTREAIAQTLFRPDNGLFFLSPWVAVALVGGVALLGRKDARKRIGAEIVACLLVVTLSLLFVCSLAPEFGRAGWSVGPRYASAAIPFAGWLLAATLGTYRSAAVWTIAGATILYSVFVHVVAAVTYPHWPTGVSNPLWEISIRALRENLAPYSLGTLLGARGIVSLVPVLVVAAATAWWLVVRGWKTGIVAVAAAGLALAFTSRIPSTTPPGKWDFVARTWAPKR
jgi:hypothetical protein